MRVLRVSHSAVVSAWRERERELRRRGVEVELLSARRWNEAGRPVPFTTDGDDFASPVSTVGTHPNLFLFDPRPIWRALRRDWDVLDVHEEPCSVAVAEVFLLRALARSRTPIVLYSAQNIDKRYPIPFRWLEGYALRHASGVSVCNVAAGEILRRKGMSGVVAQIPLGVDLDASAPRERSAPGDAIRVGYVGRLEAHKGVRTAIDAITQLPLARLDIVGAGPEESELRACARASGVESRVNFRGAVDSSSLPEVYREFDVVVIPSLPTKNWLEQFGRVAVEAMASGVPVVASESGELPEVIGSAGILVPPGDVAEWARAITTATEPERWAQLRRAGLDRCGRFSWTAVSEEMHSLYESVVSAGLPGRKAQADRQLKVVVVAYGPSDKLDHALSALGDSFSLVVVDNSSSQTTEEVVRRHGGHYLDPGRNLGFAAGVNAAIKSIGDTGVDVLLLNPDAEVSAADVKMLHDALASDTRLAAVAPVQVGLDGVYERVEWPFPTPARAWLEAAGLGRLISGRKTFLIGSVLLLRAEALADVGAFDERFFLYAEETDWQRRARSRGWQVRLISEARAAHEGAGTGGDPSWRNVQFYASHELYIRKHFGPAGWQLFRTGALLGAAARSVVLTGKRRAGAQERLRVYLRGPVYLNQAPSPPHAGAAS